MIKELESLERLKTFCHSENGYPYNQYSQSLAMINSDLTIIETSLKRLVYLEERVDDLKDDKKDLQAHNQMLSRYFKALQIIKRSPVMIICELRTCVIDLKLSYEEYCEMFPDEEDRSIKSKEEYDLLKEVLL